MAGDGIEVDTETGVIVGKVAHQSVFWRSGFDVLVVGAQPGSRLNMDRVGDGWRRAQHRGWDATSKPSQRAVTMSRSA